MTNPPAALTHPPAAQTNPPAVLTHPMAELTGAGVSVWLDDLSRERLFTGNLVQLVQDYQVTGVTTNPTIFAAALSGSSFYHAQLEELAGLGVDAEAAIRAITTDDVRAACDLLAPVYDSSGGQDGRVSIEVSPRLALQTDATITEAAELWTTVDRPNVLIKIPATQAGLAAITATLAQGISVNVTLIFSLDRYRAVIDAYLSGLEQAAANGHDLAKIHSVASFFISRVDADVDARLNAHTSPEAAALKGQAAIANARLAYAVSTRSSRSTGSPGCRLKAPTGNVRCGPPPASRTPPTPTPGTSPTWSSPAPSTPCPRRRCSPSPTTARSSGDQVTGTAAQAQQVLDDLADLGISYDEVVDQLERDGVAKFIASWDELVATVDTALTAAR